MRAHALCSALAALAMAGLGLPQVARAQDRPPGLGALPTVTSPSGAAAVVVTLRISPTGRGRVVACEGLPLDCGAVRAAVWGARFTPAMRAGAPIEARARLRYVFAPSAPPSDAARVASRSELGVTAEVERAATLGAHRLTLEQSRDQPGALGDPFRALSALPGLVPMEDAFPFYFVRAAPPQGTAYIYDDIPLPALFHVMALPAVVHPRMLGTLELSGGIAPARFGRHTGGVIQAAGPPRVQGAAGEAELRLLDVSGFAAAEVDDVRFSVAGRLGYPGYMVGLVLPGAFISFWDYQVRGAIDLGRGARVELVALGAHDVLSLPESAADAGINDLFAGSDMELTFHRAELRLIVTRGRTEVGAAARVGFDQSSYRGVTDSISRGLRLDMGLGGARAWARGGDRTLSWRAGVEWIGRRGTYDRLETDQPPLGDPILAGLFGTRQRTHGSAHAEIRWSPLPELTILGGARTDVFFGPEGADGAVDPRLRAVVRLDSEWSLQAGVGSAHQPAFWSLPAPGFSELPVRLGLQRAYQSELGVRWSGPLGDLGPGLFDLKGFANRHEDVIPPLVPGLGDWACATLGCSMDRGIRASQWAVGAELLVRARIAEHLDAQLAYTLTWLDADPLQGGYDYTPLWDVRHVLNLLLGYDSRDGFTVGVRGFLRSGMMEGFFYVEGEQVGRYEQRLPWYGRADATVAYAWDAGWARLRLSAEWINVTFALGGEPRALLCETRFARPRAPCPTFALSPVFLPNVGLRGTFD